MKALILPADLGACGHYRLVWPGMAASEEESSNWTTAILAPGVVQMRRKRSWSGGETFEVRGLPDLSDIDVVVLQRVGTENGVRLVQWFQEQGIAVVLDADDALWAIERENYSFKAWNGDGRRSQHWQYMDEAARLADLVTVTTDALARRYGGHGRVEIIPNFVPDAAVISEEKLDQRLSRPDTVRVGWSGTLASHPNDLPIAHPAVHIANNTGAEIHVVGDGKGVASQWNLPLDHVTATGSVPLDQWHSALDTLDVGLVPLSDSVFNRSKSSLKALEYLARGVATIATPTPANRALAKSLGHGARHTLRLAENPGEWVSAVKDFVHSRERRVVAGHLARSMVLGQMTIEGNINLWTEAWERASLRRLQLTGRKTS